MAHARHDYVADVRKYVPNPDPAAVDGIVKHLGGALYNKDAAQVAASDKAELTRVREGFLKKKLGLMESDAALDAALGDVMKTMGSDHHKSRVAAYYLLADKFGKLGVFGKA